MNPHLATSMAFVKDSDENESWAKVALDRLKAEERRSGETPLLKLQLPQEWNIDLYLKDESRQPTGSLKHRVARSLFIYAICNGWIRAGTHVVEASSGSTAVSEAYFAKILGLPFTAVMPKATSAEKISRIEAYGAACVFVDDPRQIYDVARRVASEQGGIFLDQFTYAERATSWHEAGGLPARIYDQLQNERYPTPVWFAVGAGTGGTSAALGRFAKFNGLNSRVCIADPDGSVYARAWREHNRALTAEGSRIEGIGRPRVEPSFIPEVIDEVVQVTDSESIAGMRYLSRRLGQLVGGSSGTAFWAAMQLIARMRVARQTGSVVAIICDHGNRYLDTYFDDAWLAEEGIDPAADLQLLQDLLGE